MTSSNIRTLLFLVVFTMALIPTIGLAQKVSKDQERTTVAVERTKKATAVLKAVAALPDGKGIPKDVTEKMNLFGVIPEASQLSLLFSKGFGGRGVSSVKLNGIWGQPAFYGFSQANGVDFTGVSYKHFDIIMAVVNADFRTKAEKKRDKKSPPSPGVPDKPRPYFYIFADGVLKPITLKNGFINIMLGAQTFLIYEDKLNKTIYGAKGDNVLLGKTDPAKQTPFDISSFQSALNDLYLAKKPEK